MTLGERIKKLRQIAGLTQEELAAAIGYSHKTSISKIENDKLDINQSTVVALARALNTTPSIIMGWTEIEEVPAKPNQSVAPQSEMTDNENHQSGYTPQEQNLVANYRQLNTANQRKVDEYVTDLLRGGRNSKTVEKDIAAFGGVETVAVNAAKLDEVVEKLLKEKGLI